MGARWLAGIFPPIATAFAPDGALRPTPDGLLEFLRDGGLDGVVVLGSNGEAAQLTGAERVQAPARGRRALPSPLRPIARAGAATARAPLDRTRGAAAGGTRPPPGSGPSC